MWSKDTVCDRDWLLQNVLGATALIVLVTDRVSLNLVYVQTIIWASYFLFFPVDRCRGIRCRSVAYLMR